MKKEVVDLVEICRRKLEDFIALVPVGLGVDYYSGNFSGGLYLSWKVRDYFDRKRTGRANKKGVIADYLPWVLIAVAVLAIVMAAIFVMKGQGFSLIDKIKDLIRMR
ncbi:MAG: hypothetical protein KKF67_00170 [Nanoarchaeota archaeon]|nr:hypothetical protein [Nanoarchaeota archaeon]